MDYTKRVFLGLVANCICKEKRITEIDFQKLDSDELIRLSRINTVSAIVYSASKEFDEVPKDLLGTLREDFMKSVWKMSKYKTVLDMVAEKLAKADFPYVLVKGKTIAKCYPSEELRDMSDLDIVVPQEKFEEAKEYFLTFCEEKPIQVSHEYEISFVIDIVNIELHCNVAYKKNLSGKVDYEKYFKDISSHSVPNEGINEVEPSVGFIFDIYHMAQHFYYGGCGVRMITDIAVQIRYYENKFDWDEILDSLKEIGLFEFAINIFSIVDDRFGIRVPSGQYKKRNIPEECIEYFVDAGIFGASNINSDVGTIRKSDSTLRWVFPSYGYMREYCEWFENKPAFLLPVAYVVRMFKGLGKRGGLIKGISVTEKTKKDLAKQKEIVKTMGLE
ncbi:MAG: nucleotidyltransferase family protein [Eubacterium sp.]|nr:nucleotidyltransferase family protein [Eubacterium sp.]